jgi:hypothetical protein
MTRRSYLWGILRAFWLLGCAFWTIRLGNLPSHSALSSLVQFTGVLVAFIGGLDFGMTLYFERRK